MGKQVDPSVEVPLDAPLATSPARIIVPHLPPPLSDSLDRLVEQVLGGPSPATARSRIVSALVLATPLEEGRLARLIDDYRGAAALQGTLRAVRASGWIACTTGPVGPRNGRPAARTARVSARKPLKSTQRFRAIALVVPVAVSERLDLFLDAVPQRPVAQGRPTIHRTSRQEFLAAILLRAKDRPADVASALMTYDGAAVGDACRELGAGGNVMECRRYRPGPRPVQ